MTQQRVVATQQRVVATQQCNRCAIVCLISSCLLLAVGIPVIRAISSSSSSPSSPASTDCRNFDYSEHTSDSLVDGIYGDPIMTTFVSEAQTIVQLMDRIWTPVTHFTMVAKKENTVWADNVDWLTSTLSPESTRFLQTTEWADQNANSYNGNGRIFLTIQPQDDNRFYLIAHEYFHAQQHVMVGPTFHTPPEPKVWMTEGCATIIGMGVMDHLTHSGIENSRSHIVNALNYVDHCGAAQETYDGVITNYYCSSLLVLTLWHLSNIYPCSRTVWESYCVDGSPFTNVYAVPTTDVYSQVSSINIETMSHLLYEQQQMLNSSVDARI